MIILYVKKTMTSNGGQIFKAGDVFVTSEEAQEKLTKALELQNIKNAVEFMPIDWLWEPFEYGMTSEMLLIRTGGIGDILALSCIGAHCWYNTIKLLTAPSFIPVVKWWSTNNVYARSILDPVYQGYQPIRANLIRKTTRRILAEAVTNEGLKENWYEVFFGAIGVKKIPVEMLKPQLSKIRISKAPSHIDLSKPSILVAHSASAQMRSFTFELAYRAILDVIGDMDVNIYVHFVSLTKVDIAFFETIDDTRIKVIQDTTVEEYLLDLFDCTVTFSTDTAAIHFREGVDKPGIAIYSAFTKDCRTKFYTKTLSFDLISECDLQPCFIHQETKDHICPKAIPEEMTAPCMGRMCPNAQQQIVDNMKDYLLTHLNAGL